MSNTTEDWIALDYLGHELDLGDYCLYLNPHGIIYSARVMGEGMKNGSVLIDCFDPDPKTVIQGYVESKRVILLQLESDLIAIKKRWAKEESCG